MSKRTRRKEMSRRRRTYFYFEEGIDQHPLSAAVAVLFGRVLRPLVWERPTGASYFEGERVW